MKTGGFRVLTVFSPGKDQVLPDGDQLKQCEKDDNLASWLNFKWKNKFFYYYVKNGEVIPKK